MALANHIHAVGARTVRDIGNLHRCVEELSSLPNSHENRPIVVSSRAKGVQAYLCYHIPLLRQLPVLLVF